MIPNNVFQIISQINPSIVNLRNVNTPDEFAQQLLNSGRVDQSMVNRAKQMWNQPNVRQMIQNRFKF